VERDGDQEVTVTYDDEKAGVEKMMDLLSREKYPVSGKPVFVQ
jgi:hypothetical protein